MPPYTEAAAVVMVVMFVFSRLTTESADKIRNFSKGISRNLTTSRRIKTPLTRSTPENLKWVEAYRQLSAAEALGVEVWKRIQQRDNTKNCRWVLVVVCGGFRRNNRWVLVVVYGGGNGGFFGEAADVNNGGGIFFVEMNLFHNRLRYTRKKNIG